MGMNRPQIKEAQLGADLLIVMEAALMKAWDYHTVRARPPLAISIDVYGTVMTMRIKADE
jgi:hypothetical protein